MTQGRHQRHLVPAPFCAAAVCLALVATALLASPALAQQRRLALVVGENRGLVNEELLRFAETDAQRVRDTLVDVGGFTPDEVLVR